MSASELANALGQLTMERGQVLETTRLTLTGTLLRRRRHSATISFLDICDSLQVKYVYRYVYMDMCMYIDIVRYRQI